MKKIYADSTLNISQGDFERPASIKDVDINCNSETEGEATTPVEVDEFGF